MDGLGGGVGAEQIIGWSRIASWQRGKKLAKGIVSEGSGFGFGLANLGQSLFLDSEFKRTMFTSSLRLITE